jgi:1-acyl-sn-glycerol-3-phosphate acyltransferase
MIRSFFVILTVGLATLILGLPTLLVDFISRRGRFHSQIMRLWSKILLWTAAVRIEVKGVENLKVANPAVVMFNHESALDIPIATASLPIPVRFLVKKELMRVPFFGWILSLGGHISIDRNNPTRAVAEINRRSTQLIKNKLNIILSPEGTRSKDGRIAAFKKGGFKIAEQYDLPIIPVTLLGPKHIVARKKLRVYPGQVKVIINPALKVSDFKNLSDCMQAVRKLMIQQKTDYETERKVRSC